MILYRYYCFLCGSVMDMYVDTIDNRDDPLESPCPDCQEMGLKRSVGSAGFTVPEGGCGNAANGYSSYHGDSENFKKGRKIYK